MPKTPSKKHFRWKRIATLKIYIEVASTGKMWRVVTPAETSAPMAIEELNQAVTVNASTGETYRATARITRIKARVLPEPVNQLPIHPDEQL